MKKVLIFLLVTSMLSGMLCTTAFAETGGTAVISPSEFACIKNGDENKTGLDGSGYFMVSSAKSDNDPANPVESGFWKYDLSQYLDEGYGIEKAEMLLLADSYTWLSETCMYDCPTDDLKTGSNYLTVPKTSKDSLIARFSNQNLSSVSENYSGVDGDYNVAVDITDYVKGKISDGKKSFTYMLYPKWGESTYRFKGEPVLYITLGEKNTDAPLIEYISDNSGDENAKNFTASVNATDSNGVEKVEFYLDGVLMDGKVEKTETTYTYTGRILSPGAHTLTVKAYDTYGKTSTYTKEISVSSTIAILDPYAKVHVKNGDESSSSVSANGGGNVSNIGGGSKDVENPIEALYYRFDLSEYTQNNIGIEKAYILQNAEGRNYSTLLGMYDCADDTLENGMNYLTVPKASLDGLVTSFNVTNPANVDLSKYPGVTNDYNLEFDVTEYVQKKADRGTGFTYMLYPKYDGSAYTFSSAPILYLKLGAQNPDYPVAEFVSAKTQYTDSGNFTEQIKASDSNGIGSIEFYLGDNRIEGDFEKSGDIYTFTGAPLVSGSYTLKAVVRDIYGRSTSCEKDITVTMTHTVTEPAAMAYTAWGDESQTSEKYTPDWQGGTGYWIISSGSEGETYYKDSDYWVKPTRVMYNKFDISEYLNSGYAIKRAYLLQNGTIGSGALYDCPADTLKDGDNYLTAPAMNPDGLISHFSLGTNSEQYVSKEDLAYRFPGAGKDNNFALDITGYVNEKVRLGKTSFTFAEYARYTADRYCLYSTAQLYLEFTEKPVVKISDIGEAFQGRSFEVSASAAHSSGIKKVDFYINDVLAATATEEKDGVYTAEISGYDGGAYVLKAVAEATDGGVGYDENTDFSVNAIYANIAPGSYLNCNADGTAQLVNRENEKNDLYYTFDISHLTDAEKIEKVFYVQNANSSANGAPAIIYDCAGSAADGTPVQRAEAAESSPVIAPLDSYYTGAAKFGGLTADLTDFIKGKIESGEGSVTLKISAAEGTRYSINSMPSVYVRYKTGNSDIDQMYKPSLASSAFEEFSAGGTLYLKTDGSASLNDLQKDLTEYGGCAFAALRNGESLAQTQALKLGDTVLITDGNGKTVRTYNVIENNYISDISADVIYGRCEASAYVDVFADNLSAKLVIAAYKNGKFAGCGVSGYENLNGGYRLTATVNCEDADEFKAMLWDFESLKPLKKSESVKRQVVLLKFDDLSMYTYEKFEDLRLLLKDYGIKAGFGMIVDSFDPENEESRAKINNYDVKHKLAKAFINRAQDDGIEFWHHGYYHYMDEYYTYSYEKQSECFGKGYDVMVNELGIDLRAFGSPFNNATDVTLKMLKENYPNINVLMLVNSKYEVPEGMVNFNDAVTIETSSSKIDSAMFIDNFNKKSDSSYMVAQMHPGSWDTNVGYDSWSEFKICLDYLISKGVVFMTPSQYYEYINN